MVVRAFTADQADTQGEQAGGEEAGAHVRDDQGLSMHEVLGVAHHGFAPRRAGLARERPPPSVSWPVRWTPLRQLGWEVDTDGFTVPPSGDSTSSTPATSYGW